MNPKKLEQLQKEFEPVLKISEREFEVFHRMGLGDSSKQAGAALGISVKTVESHVAHICEKTGIPGAVKIRTMAVRFGLFAELTGIKRTAVTVDPTPFRFTQN